MNSGISLVPRASVSFVLGHLANVYCHCANLYSGGSRILKEGFQCALVSYTWQSVIKRASALVRRIWGHARTGNFNFLISDILRWFLVPFWGKLTRIERPTATSCHCEAFKSSQNLKPWLRFAPQKLQSSSEARGKKNILASYCTRSDVMHCEVGFLLLIAPMVATFFWYSCRKCARWILDTGN